MLQKIRDNASGPLAYVVVGVIAVVFGVWGIGSYFTPSADPVVASVGGQDILSSRLQRTTQQLQQRESDRIQQFQKLSNGKIDLPRTPLDQLRSTALQMLINNTVVTAYADDAGYRVSDSAVLSALRNDPQFQDNGKFSAERYRALLSGAGIVPAQYEASLRQDIKSRQLRSEIVNSAFASPAEVDQAYRLSNQQRDVRYLSFDPANYRDRVDVTDAQVKTYYREHTGQFQRPERVKLAYVSLDRSSAAGSAKPDEQTLRALYEQNKAQLGEPETRTGGEIRVPIEGDGSAAREIVQKLAGALGANDVDLEQIAEQTNGANYVALNSVKRADLPPAEGDALFTMKAGERSSAPVRGEKAWYLLNLKSVAPAKTPSFDDPDIQASLTTIAQAQQASAAYEKKVDRLESLAYEAPNDLKTLADELGLAIQHTEWLTRDGGGGIGQYDAIRKAAFSDAVLKDRLNSTPIQLGAERRVVLRVQEREASQTLPLASVSKRIRNRLVAEKAGDQAREAAETALSKIRNGDATFDAIAKGDTGPSLKNIGFIGRANDDTDGQIREAAFAMPQPGNGKRDYKITQTSNGMVAVLAVDSVREAPKSENQTPRSQFASQQRSYVAQQEYAALSEYLRGQVDVEVNDNRVGP